MKRIRISRRKFLFVAGTAAVALGAMAASGTAFAAEANSGATGKTSARYAQTERKGQVSCADIKLPKGSVPAQKAEGRLIATTDSKGLVCHANVMPSKGGVPAEKR